MKTSVSRCGPRSRASRSFSARFASGLLVKFCSWVRDPPSREEIRTIDTTAPPTQNRIVRHGLRLLARARDWVERRIPPSLNTPTTPDHLSGIVRSTYDVGK